MSNFIWLVTKGLLLFPERMSPLLGSVSWGPPHIKLHPEELLPNGSGDRLHQKAEFRRHPQKGPYLINAFSGTENSLAPVTTKCLFLLQWTEETQARSDRPCTMFSVHLWVLFFPFVRASWFPSGNWRILTYLHISLLPTNNGKDL